MSIKLSDKGKKALRGDIVRRMGIAQGNKDMLFEYFKDYDGELRKIYSAWDSYDRIAWVYNLTK